jgi:hypothetical protein
MLPLMIESDRMSTHTQLPTDLSMDFPSLYLYPANKNGGVIQSSVPTWHLKLIWLPMGGE